MRAQRCVLGCLLVAIYSAVPLAALAADNRSFVAPWQLVKLVLAVAIPLLIVVLLIAWRKGPATSARAAAVLAIAVLFVFDYREVRVPLNAITNHAIVSTLFLWTLLLVLIAFVALRLARRYDGLVPLMLLMGVVMLAPPLKTYADFQLTAEPAEAHANGALPLHLSDKRNAPDVFFFLLDAHGRADRLKTRFDYDEKGLLAQLHAEGYVVPGRSRTAYGITALSVPSILQADYVAGAGRVDFARFNPIMAGRNRVVATFRRLGYTYALAPSQFGGWNCEGDEDLCVKPSTAASEIGVSDLNWAAIERTPLADILKKRLPSGPAGFRSGRQFPSRVVSSILARPHPKPVFTFAHVLLSHPPYLYRGRSCHYDPTIVNKGKAADRIYVEALQCTDAEVSAAARAIAKRDPDAIVIFASDHGSDVDANHGVPEWTWTHELLRRRFSNFSALRLPPSCRSSVPADVVTVDLFRIVLNCIADPNLPLLGAREYLVDQPSGVIRPFR